jgi:hypothetical protein
MKTLGVTKIIVFLFGVLPLPVTANVVLISPILVTLLMKSVLSSETSVLTITRRNIPQDDILLEMTVDAITFLDLVCFMDIYKGGK